MATLEHPTSTLTFAGLCPKSLQWFGPTAGIDSVHSVQAECGGVGSCNRETGACKCQEGFSGAACEKSELSLTCADLDIGALGPRHVILHRSDLSWWLKNSLQRQWPMRVHAACRQGERRNRDKKRCNLLTMGCRQGVWLLVLSWLGRL